MIVNDEEKLSVTVSGGEETYHVDVIVRRDKNENGLPIFRIRYVSKSDLATLQEKGAQTLPQVLLNGALKHLEFTMYDINCEEVKLKRKEYESRQG